MATNLHIHELPEKAFGIVFGRTYKDKISGYQGVALCMSEHITGCVQWSLRGVGDINELESPVSFDFQRLEHVESVPDINLEKIVSKTQDFELGSVLRDKISKIEGVAIVKSWSYDGSVDYVIQPQGMTKDNEPRKLLAYESMRLELVEPRVEVFKAPIEPKKDNPGRNGPATGLRLPSRM